MLANLCRFKVQYKLIRGRTLIFCEEGDKMASAYSYLLNNGKVVTTYNHPHSEIINRLARIAVEEGFPLTSENIARHGEAPFSGSIKKYVGDMDQVNKWVKKHLEKTSLLKGAIEMGGKHRTEEQMLREYYDLWSELGIAPSGAKLEQAMAEGKSAGRSSYARHFGSLSKVRELTIAKYGDPTESPESESLPTQVEAQPLVMSPVPEEENQPPEALPIQPEAPSAPEANMETPPLAKIEFISWLPYPIRLASGNWSSDILRQSAYTAVVIRTLENHFDIDGFLAICDQIGAMANAFKEHFVLKAENQAGERIDFPAPAPNVFHIVEKSVLEAALFSGRTVSDLFYPSWKAPSETGWSKEHPCVVKELRTISLP